MAFCTSPALSIYNFGFCLNRIVVVMLTETCVCDTEPKKPLREILRYKTCENQKGLVAITESNLINAMAIMGVDKGSIRIIYDNENQQYDTVIKAHNSSLAAISISRDGKLVATASEKGTKIKLFDAFTGKMLKELHRGKKKAEIYSISFSSDSRFLAVSSDRETIHVFSTYSGKFADKSLTSVAQIKDVKGKNISTFDDKLCHA